MKVLKLKPLKIYLELVLVLSAVFFLGMVAQQHAQLQLACYQQLLFQPEDETGDVQLWHDHVYDERDISVDVVDPGGDEFGVLQAPVGDDHLMVDPTGIRAEGLLYHY